MWCKGWLPRRLALQKDGFTGTRGARSLQHHHFAKIGKGAFPALTGKKFKPGQGLEQPRKYAHTRIIRPGSDQPPDD